ncbi:MAG TPA: EamA family transporter [Chitinophagaceae bacterium]|nr:EamA family transporter [Chitinophagaceae bacterium]
MTLFDINKTITQTGDSFKQLSVLNPLTIRKKGRRAKAVFALSLVCFFWGTTWLASKEGVKYMPALQLAGIRQFLGGLCYVIFFLIKKVPLPKRKEWITILILGGLNFLLSNGLTTWSVKYISAGLAAIIAAMFPLWLVVINLFASKSRISWKPVVGFIIGFVGICVIFYEHLHDFFNKDFQFGIMLSVLATWSWAFGTLYTKQQAANFNPYFSLGLQMLISGFCLIILTNVTGQAVPMTAIPWQSWASISYLVIFGSVISFIAYLYALQNLSAEQTSLYAYVNPVVAVLLGWLLLSERLTPFIAVGGVVALFGVYVVNKAYRTPSPGMPETEGV